MYRDIAIACRVEPELRSFGALPNLVNSAADFATGRFALLKPAGAALVSRIADATRQKFDLIHFNHEGLWLLARALRVMLPNTPFTMHVRKVLPDNVAARVQVAGIQGPIDRLVYISSGEERAFARHGCRVPGTVIHNIVEHSCESAAPLEGIAPNGRFVVASLANYSWGRGVDRILDVVEEMARRGRRDVLFVFAGNQKLPASLPHVLGEIGRRGGTLADAADKRGIAEYCQFLGHVSEPHQVLSASDMLIKLARRDFPWGRDVLEALSASRPVLTTGTDVTFVETDVTGHLMAHYTPALAADVIEAWADDRNLAKRLGENGRRRVMQACDGKARAADLVQVWRAALKSLESRAGSRSGLDDRGGVSI